MGTRKAATLAALPAQALLCKSSSARPMQVSQLKRWLHPRAEAWNGTEKPARHHLAGKVAAAR
eukprot:4767747-Alexandrium_andersonii.AAC.1